MGQNGVHFGTHVFPKSAPWVPKGPPDDLIRALFGPRGRPRTSKSGLWGGPKTMLNKMSKKQWILRPSALENCALVQARCAFCKKEMFWKRSQKGAKMEPKCMPNLTTGGHGPPRSGQGGTSTPFGALRERPGVRKRGSQNKHKNGPSKNHQKTVLEGMGGPGPGDFAECAVAAGR